MTYFKRDNAAARIQERDWALAKRVAEYVPKPCTYCGVRMTVSTPETQGRWTNETRDHIIPKSKGGTETVPCCEGCNRDKHHLTLNEWRCVLMLRMKRPVLFYYFEILAMKNWLIFHSSLLSRLLSC